MANGKPFTYKKPFGDSDVEYEVTPKFDGSTIHFAVKMKQSYTFIEDEVHNKTEEEKDAKFDVKTDVTGAGTIEFDTVRGRVVSSKIVADAASGRHRAGDEDEVGSEAEDDLDLQARQVAPECWGRLKASPCGSRMPVPRRVRRPAGLSCEDSGDVLHAARHVASLHSLGSGKSFEASGS